MTSVSTSGAVILAFDPIAKNQLIFKISVYHRYMLSILIWPVDGTMCFKIHNERKTIFRYGSHIPSLIQTSQEKTPLIYENRF